LLAAWLLASTPGVFFYFVDANPYTILIFWSALSTGLMMLASQRDTPGSWAAYSLAALGGLASHTLFIFHIGGQCLLFARARTAHIKRMEELLHRNFWRKQKKFLTTLVILLVAWVGWACYFLLNRGYANAPVVDRAISFGALFSTAGMIPGPLTYDPWPHGLIFACLLATGLFLLWRENREVCLQLLLLWIPPIIGISLFVRTSSYVIGYRYGLGAFPITCILLAAIFSVWRPNWRNIAALSRWEMILILVTGLCIASGTLRLVLSSPDYSTYSDWKGCARYLEKRVGPGDKIWFAHEEYSFPLAYYFGRRDQIVISPSLDLNIETADLASRQKQVASQRGTVWVVIPSFQNRNALIERFTRIVPKPRYWRVFQLDSRLQFLAGLSLLQDQDFDRIRVLKVSAR
jgi:hypothetical protein